MSDPPSSSIINLPNIEEKNNNNKSGDLVINTHTPGLEKNSITSDLLTNFKQYDDILTLYSTNVLYYRVVNPDGKIAILFIHGGPGDTHAVFSNIELDNRSYKFILYDQCGCGKSRTGRKIINLPVSELVDQIEELRKHLNIQSWLLLGYSYGAYIALNYNKIYRKHVTGIIMVAPWFGSDKMFCSYFKIGNLVCKDYLQQFIRLLKKYYGNFNHKSAKTIALIFKRCMNSCSLPEKLEIAQAWTRLQYFLIKGESPGNVHFDLNEDDLSIILQQIQNLSKSFPLNKSQLEELHHKTTKIWVIQGHPCDGVCFLKLLPKCCQSHIIKLHQTYKDEKYLYLLLEYFNGGELYEKIPPEVILNKNNDQKSDVFAFGCVMYQVATGFPPFVGS
uniref:prolyl aminopeptidase n=1 Tax=Dermatophagoides pteronyssinus TaxID=6956 RepID=A0A6P6Y9Q2_DERPT|nr:uncharacterized protein LOC113796143 [Dermatophagoides pteronyssinus]